MMCAEVCPTCAVMGDFDRRLIAVIDRDLCIGCGICKKVCQFEAISGQPKGIYEVNEACTGCGQCAPKCPKKAITLPVREHARCQRQGWYPRREQAKALENGRRNGKQGSVNMKLGFISLGNMATAILKGVIGKGFLSPDDIAIFDVNPTQCEKLTEQYPIHVALTQEELIAGCEHIVLAVKPVYLQRVLEKARPLASGKDFISIAAELDIWNAHRYSGC